MSLSASIVFAIWGGTFLCRSGQRRCRKNSRLGPGRIFDEGRKVAATNTDPRMPCSLRFFGELEVLETMPLDQVLVFEEFRICVRSEQLQDVSRIQGVQSGFYGILFCFCGE